MEVLLVKAVYDRLVGFRHVDQFKAEGDADGGDDKEKMQPKNVVILTVSIFVTVCLGVLAAYLSWCANRIAGWNVMSRVVFALFAFCFGSVYMVLHVMLKGDLVLQAYRRMRQDAVGSQTQQQQQQQQHTTALERRLGGEVVFVKVRPAWLVNSLTGHRMELDMFNEERMLAVEYNGPQHYAFPNAYHGTSGEFERQVARDLLKAQLCEAHGVRLIVVRARWSTWMELDEFEALCTTV